jgi:hypothetical protein
VITTEMNLTHNTSTDVVAQRGPSILVEGTFGVPYYRHADFPEPVATSELTAQQRACLMRELATWLTEASTSAQALAHELEIAELDAVIVANSCEADCPHVVERARL